MGYYVDTLIVCDTRTYIKIREFWIENYQYPKNPTTNLYEPVKYLKNDTVIEYTQEEIASLADEYDFDGHLKGLFGSTMLHKIYIPNCKWFNIADDFDEIFASAEFCAVYTIGEDNITDQMVYGSEPKGYDNIYFSVEIDDPNTWEDTNETRN